MFSQGHNRDIWKWHDAAKGHNLGVELLCSSKEGSLKGFYLQKQGCSDGEMAYEVRFKEPDGEGEVVEELQRGVRAFVKVFQQLYRNIGREKCLVYGTDAYGVLRVFLEKRNYDCSMKAINSSGRKARIELDL